MKEEIKDKIETAVERAERKRAELIAAFRAKKVRDPISLLITVGISLAVSAVTAGLTYLLTPRRRFTVGDKGGEEFFVQRSAQGIPIPEIYGADPGDGLGGGVRLAPIIAWLSRLPDGSVARKNTSTTQVGGKGGPKPQEQTTITYSIDGVLLMWGRGVCRLKTLWAATDILYSTSDTGVEATYQAEAGVNTLTGGAATVLDVDASGGSAVTVPNGGQVAWNSVARAGATSVILYFYYKADIPARVEMRWNGNFFTDTLPATGGEYVMGYHSAPYLIENATGNVIRCKNISSAALRLDKLGVRAVTAPTGVPNGNVDSDDDYDLVLPPTAITSYTRPTDRFTGSLIEDGEGGLGGTISGGNYAGIAHHDGRDDQLPDAIVEAAVDGEFGEGSTPAYRGRPTTRLSNFYLTRYQEVFPPMSALLEHKLIRNLDQCFDHWCDRVGLEAADYDFTAIPGLAVRGLVVNPPYEPKGVMEELGRVFNVYFTDTDKIRAFPQDGSSVATIDDSELGWIEDEPDESNVLPELFSDLPAETELSRRVTLRYFDPSRNNEQNAQSDARQITTSEREETIDVQLAMTADEAREVAARELYQGEVEAVTHRFSLSYEYLYLNPGDIVTVTRDEGFTHSIRLTSINYTIGVLECEGYAVDTATFTQPATGVGGTEFEIPPVPIPGMSILGVWDGPLLRDNENSVNNGAGFYAWATKRQGDGHFPGASLYVDRGLGYSLLESFEAEAVSGVCLNGLTASTSINGIVADTETVDLRHPDHALESFTEEQVWAGAGAAVFGDEVCQILSATREPDTVTFPNRWYVTVGRRGQRGTDFAIDDHQAGERFLLINSAVKFIPLDLNELNVERDYRLVTSGQSLDDAATVAFAWTGGSLKPLGPAIGDRQPPSGTGDLLIRLTPSTRIGAGLRAFYAAPRAEEEDVFYIRFPGATPPRTVKVVYEPEPAVRLLEREELPSSVYELTAQTIDSLGGSLSAIVTPGILGAAIYIRNDATGNDDYYLDIAESGSDILVTAKQWDGSTLATLGSVLIASVSTVKVSIKIRGGDVLFYATTIEGQPLAEFARGTIWAGDKPRLRGGLFYHLSSTIDIVQVDTGGLTYVYTEVDQINDFGSACAPGTLDVEAWQYSSLVGQGYVTERTL